MPVEFESDWASFNGLDSDLIYDQQALKSKFKFQVFPDCQDRKTNSSVCFLGEVTTRQFYFEIYWPLGKQSKCENLIRTHGVVYSVYGNLVAFSLKAHNWYYQSVEPLMDHVSIIQRIVWKLTWKTSEKPKPVGPPHWELDQALNWFCKEWNLKTNQRRYTLIVIFTISHIQWFFFIF